MAKNIDPEKLRDMMRSILPSVARKGARRAKANENRKVRRGLRRDLRGDYEDADLTRDTYLAHIVQRRRDADKLNHYVRWCRHLTYGMTKQQALDFVRSMLPRNVIGDHAFGHWKTALRYRGGARCWCEVCTNKAQSLFDRLRTRLGRILREDPVALRELNALVKSKREPERPPLRMLHGLHDVDDYVRDVLKTCIEKRCLLEFIENYTKGGRDGRPSDFYGRCAPYRSASTFAGAPSTSVTMKRLSKIDSSIAGTLPPRAWITSCVVSEWPTITTVPPLCFSRTIFAIRPA